MLGTVTDGMLVKETIVGLASNVPSKTSMLGTVTDGIADKGNYSWFGK